MSFLDILNAYFKPRDDGRMEPSGLLDPAPAGFDRKAFFDHCRAGVMGPTLSADEVEGAAAILTTMAGAPLSWTAYALATAWHETAHTLKPIKEYGGPAYFHRMYDLRGQRPALARKMGNVNPGDGVKFCGRGYVQLTWRSNYRLAGQKLNLPLEAQPDMALRPDVAAKIMRSGMTEGWFTGKAFRHYLDGEGKATSAQFAEARRIINGVDKAKLIAGYAVQFQSALLKGGWK